MTEARVFEARAIRKSYGATAALRGVDFSLKRGEIRGLIGANGAGKSTLCKIIAGVEQPTSGELRLSGQPISFHSVRDAMAKGVGIIHQELSLFPNLSVAENIFVGRELLGRFGLVDNHAQVGAAGKLLERLGAPINPRTAVGSLSVGAQQIVEIARTLRQDVSVLLMDEPTSALGRAEVLRLFDIVRALADHGVAIVYISHRLDELLEICHSLSVLRDGEMVAECESRTANAGWIVERMTGRGEAVRPTERAIDLGCTALRARNLNLPAKVGRVTLCDVELSLQEGEVIGVFGLLGAGRTELLETLLGLHRDATGQVELFGVDLAGADTAQRVCAGMAMLPEDRQSAGLFGPASVLQNMTLAIADRLAPFGLVRASAERAAAESMVSELGIKTASVDASIQALSGGNQQKVVLARNLLRQPKVLLLDEPTRGVDAAAKADILAQIQTMAARGVAVVVTSSEPSELMTVSTRLLVMSRGRIVLETTPADASDAMLLEAAAATDVSRAAA